MALTPTEIQKKSDAKRGMKVLTVKVAQSAADLLDKLAAETGRPKNALLAEALADLAAKHRIKQD